MRPFAFAFVGGIVGTVFTSMLVIAWTGPSSAPPSGNVAAPINTGATDQVKNAGLALNSLAVFGNAILSGTSRYLNFGTIAGASGYGIRDNAGTLEFKNNNGSWTALAAGGAVLSGTVGGGCYGGGGGWGNATGCTSTQVCSSTQISGSCPAGYTAQRVGEGRMICEGGPVGAPGCNCGGYSPYVTIYYPSFNPAPMLCIKD